MNFKNYKSDNFVSFIAILAICCSLLYKIVDKELSAYPYIKQISNYIVFLSILGFMWLVLKLVDVYLWKWKFSNIIINIPNLNGRYIGTMTSSYIDPITAKPVVVDCVMEISQTASNLHVHTYVGRDGKQTSKSETICEVLKKGTNNIFTLYYNYGNVSNLNIQFNDHKGTAYLEYYPDKKAFKGNYFNERLNNGEIIVELKSKKTLGRFNEEL